MLWNASKIDGYDIDATDGALGTVSDFLFDDKSWMARWLVVDTGNWLPGRKVLLPTYVLGHLDEEEHRFSVRMTRQQVKDSPDIDTDQPVSRQMEANIFDYYGWSPYWGGGFYPDSYGFEGGAIAQPPHIEPRWREEERRNLQQRGGDPHLRSIDAVNSYHVHAVDGEIGHVADMLIEDADWSIRYLVVDTRNWWPGKKVLITPSLCRNINWASSMVNLRVDRQAVKDSPTYDESTLVDRAFEQNYHHYYATSRPGDQGRSGHAE